MICCVAYMQCIDNFIFCFSVGSTKYPFQQKAVTWGMEHVKIIGQNDVTENELKDNEGNGVQYRNKHKANKTCKRSLKLQNSSWVCNLCSRTCNISEDSIQCVYCNHWVHRHCSGMTVDQYKACSSVKKVALSSVSGIVPCVT